MIAVSFALFAMQGGFGGGHGDFDTAIFVLGLPGSAITPYFGASDVLAFLFLPAIANALIWYSATRLVLRLRAPAA